MSKEKSGSRQARGRISKREYDPKFVDKFIALYADSPHQKKMAITQDRPLTQKEALEVEARKRASAYRKKPTITNKTLTPQAIQEARAKKALEDRAKAKKSLQAFESKYKVPSPQYGQFCLNGVCRDFDSLPPAISSDDPKEAGFCMNGVCRSW